MIEFENTTSVNNEDKLYVCVFICICKCYKARTFQLEIKTQPLIGLKSLHLIEELGLTQIKYLKKKYKLKI